MVDCTVRVQWQQRHRYFSPQCQNRPWQTLELLFREQWGPTSGVQQPEHEADHRPPSPMLRMCAANLLPHTLSWCNGHQMCWIWQDQIPCPTQWSSEKFSFFFWLLFAPFRRSCLTQLFSIIIKSMISLIQSLEFAAMTACKINSSIRYSLVMRKSLIHNNNCTPYIETVIATVNTNSTRHTNQYCNNLRTSAYSRMMISTTVPVGNRIAIPVVAMWGLYRLPQHVNNTFGAQIIRVSVLRMSKCMTIISLNTTVWRVFAVEKFCARQELT